MISAVDDPDSDMNVNTAFIRNAKWLIIAFCILAAFWD